MKHDKFHTGPAEAIRAKLVTEKAASGAPRACPYLLGLSPSLPGTFTIFYLPGSKQAPALRRDPDPRKPDPRTSPCACPAHSGTHTAGPAAGLKAARANGREGGMACRKWPAAQGREGGMACRLREADDGGGGAGGGGRVSGGAGGVPLRRHHLPQHRRHAQLVHTHTHTRRFHSTPLALLWSIRL